MDRWGVLHWASALSKESWRFFKPLRKNKKIEHLRYYFNKKVFSGDRVPLYIVVLGMCGNISGGCLIVSCRWLLEQRHYFHIEYPFSCICLSLGLGMRDISAVFSQRYLLRRQCDRKVLESKKSRSGNFEIECSPQRAGKNVFRNLSTILNPRLTLSSFNATFRHVFFAACCLRPVLRESFSAEQR